MKGRHGNASLFSLSGSFNPRSKACGGYPAHLLHLAERELIRHKTSRVPGGIRGTRQWPRERGLDRCLRDMDVHYGTIICELDLQGVYVRSVPIIDLVVGL